MADDRDICERLEDPSYDGALFMRQDAAKEIRALRAKIAEQEEWNSLRAMDIVTLGLEVGRLWEALQTISKANSLPSYVLEIARATRAEIARLREALDKIAALDVPRPVWKRFRTDEQPSKYDICPHVISMWDDCSHCISDYARAVLAETREK